MSDVSLFRAGRYKYPQGQIKRYTGLFGALFSGFQFLSGEKTVDVPINYAGGEARFIKRQSTADSNKTAIRLPAMAFDIVSIARDGTRKVMDNGVAPPRAATLNPKGVLVAPFKLTPTPYNLTYTLYIRTTKTEDALSIFELIQSAFAQTVNVTVIDDVETKEERVINVSMASDPRMSSTDEAQFEQARYVEIEIDFLLKGFLYTPGLNAPLVTSVEFLDQVIFAGEDDRNTLLNNGAL